MRGRVTFSVRVSASVSPRVAIGVNLGLVLGVSVWDRVELA